MFCPYCKTPVQDGMAYCAACGAALNAAPACGAQYAAPPIRGGSNDTAIAAFVMALVSLVFPILVFPAIVFGHIGLKNSQKTPERTGRGMAIAALLIGYFTVAIWLLTALVVILFCIFYVLIFACVMVMAD